MGNILPHHSFSSMLRRFDPFRDDDWLKGAWFSPFARDMEFSPQIRIDLTENDKSYTVRAEIPGVRKEDIKIRIDGNRVSISTETKQNKEEKKGDKLVYQECSQGSSYRSFTLDSNVDEAKAEAKYDNGVLQLTLPKKSGANTRELSVK